MRAVNEITQVWQRQERTGSRGTDGMGGHGEPITRTVHEVLWREQWHRVEQIIDEWRWAGRWWLKEVPRDYYLVRLVSGIVLELYRSRDHSGWRGERWKSGGGVSSTANPSSVGYATRRRGSP